MAKHVWLPPVADEWWMVADVGSGVTRLLERHVNPVIESNVWHVRGSDADLVIDTGNGLSDLRPTIERLSEGRPVIAVVTHGHFDHVGGLREFDDRRGHADDAKETLEPFPMRVHQDDFPEGADEMFEYYGYPMPRLIVDRLPSADFDTEAWESPGAELTSTLAAGDAIDLGDRRLEVLHVPGHTPGSIAVWESATGLLFSGDTVYAEGKLHFDDPAAAEASLTALRELPVTKVHAGHDRSFDDRELHDLIARELSAIAGG
jgi:glyoxylase-like metal-dependent hydrolase (beta-lactamase superfamily II)